MVHYLFLRGGGYHTYQEIPETFQPEFSLGGDGVDAFGKAAYVVDAVPWRQMIHIFADGVVGETEIGVNCLIGQNSRIEKSFLSDNVNILSSVVLESKIGEGTKVGPFAYLRPNSVIGRDCKIGDFVEVKNSTLGDGTKASHLTYIGDSDLGNDINLGCGVVFVNYDGTNKYRSTIEDGAFIGCNTNLVSPVNVGRGAYIAAGTTVTKNVPEDALCVGRARQKVIEGWAKERGLYRKNKDK